MIGALLSGVGGLGSSLFGMMGQNSANNTNMAIAMYNAQMQDMARREQMALAREMLNYQLADRTDAQGNKSRYIPGVGFRVENSERTQRMMDAEQREALERLTQDMQRSRAGRETNYNRRRGENTQADAYMNALRRTPDFSRDSLRSLMSRRAQEGVNQGFDDAQNALATQLVRSNAKSSNIGSQFGQIAEQRGDANRRAKLDSELDSYGMYDQMTRAREGHLGNLYNMFATRASNTDDVPFQPMGLEMGGDALMRAQAAQTPQTAGGLAAAAGRSPGMLNYQATPNFGGAHTFGGAFDFLDSLFGGQSSSPMTKTYTKQQKKHNMYKNSNGLFG